MKKTIIPLGNLVPGMYPPRDLVDERMMKIGANEVPQGIDDMKKKHHCLHQPSRKIPGCKIRGTYVHKY